MITKDEEEKLHLRYKDLIPILIKGMKEQDIRIKKLENRERDRI